MPSIPSIPNPLKGRAQKKKRSVWRWVVLALAAIAAVGWKQRTAISNRLLGGADASDHSLRLDRSAAGLTSVAGGPAAAHHPAGEAEKLAPELLTSAPADAALAWSGTEPPSPAKADRVATAPAAGAAAVPPDVADWAESLSGEAPDGERTSPADAVGGAGGDAPPVSSAETAGGAPASTDGANAGGTGPNATVAPARAETPAGVGEWVAELEGEVPDGGGGGEGGADQAAGTSAAQPTAGTTEIIPAGEDAGGTFRPDRAETDAFGVTVTDDAPAGLDASQGWIEGDGTNRCPESHPIKGNASSRIFHRPGESSYEATIPELCFATEEDAIAAGYRPRAR